MDDTDALLGPWVQRFLTQHLVTERNLSRNTCKSYRDTFKPLIPFACAQLGKQDYQLVILDLSSELVRRFLSHLEDARGCCAHTRNQRLTTIRAFAGFVASHDPIHVAWRGQISVIASKKTTSKPVAWLTVDEMHALLNVPDRRTQHDESNTRFCCSSTEPERGYRKPRSCAWATCRSGAAMAAMRSSPFTERVESYANAPFDRKSSASWSSWSTAVPQMTLSSSTGAENRSPGSGATGSSSAARPRCRRWRGRK